MRITPDLMAYKDGEELQSDNYDSDNAFASEAPASMPANTNKGKIVSLEAQLAEMKRQMASKDAEIAKLKQQLNDK